MKKQPITLTEEGIKALAKRTLSADRFRICPYPNCNKQHYVDHLGKDYCCDECADAHYNEKRRLMKQAEAMSSELDLSQKGGRVPHVNSVSEDELKETIRWLDNEPIDSEIGTIYNIEGMLARGYNFNAFTSRGKLFNIAPEHNCHFILVGSYRLYRIGISHILIINKSTY